MSFTRTTSECITIHESSKTCDGYILFAPMWQKDVFLMDMQGYIINRWEMPYVPASHAVLLPNGNLLYQGRVVPEPLPEFGGCGGKLLEVDWNGNLIWEYEDAYVHHDFHRMDNGNTMINRYVPIPDNITAKIKGGIPGTEWKGAIWSTSFREITSTGKIVWEWMGYEHMNPKIDILCPLCPRWVWGYVNSLEVLADGNILASFRNVNTIAIIDKGTGELKWRWGPGDLGHQHNASMLDNGNVLIFDNGQHRPFAKLGASYSRVLEINPKTNKIEWEYKDKNPAKFYSSVCSGSQRLLNGNTLICESTKGRIFEITGDGEIVWEFISPFYQHGSILYGWTNSIFQAHYYGPNYEGLKGRHLDTNRFEWVLQEKGKLRIEEEEEAIRDRLVHLGY